MHSVRDSGVQCVWGAVGGEDIQQQQQLVSLSLSHGTKEKTDILWRMWWLLMLLAGWLLLLSSVLARSAFSETALVVRR